MRRGLCSYNMPDLGKVMIVDSLSKIEYTISSAASFKSMTRMQSQGGIIMDGRFRLAIF